MAHRDILSNVLSERSNTDWGGREEEETARQDLFRKAHINPSLAAVLKFSQPDVRPWLDLGRRISAADELDTSQHHGWLILRRLSGPLLVVIEGGVATYSVVQ